MRTVVVGASQGIGRCIGVGLSGRGDHVALLARRRERLDEAAKEAGNDAVPVLCDVTDQQSCRDAIEQAAVALGGIDAVVYCPGVGTLSRLTDLDVPTWHRMLDTNVIGANSITAAALPHLEESGGAAAYLSSVSASRTVPWAGLGAYAVTKAALDKLVEAWRTEHPEIGFTSVVVGNCAGGEGSSMTGFADGWGGEFAEEVFGQWVAKGYLDGPLVAVEDIVVAVHTVLGIGPGSHVPEVTVTTRRQA